MGMISRFVFLPLTICLLVITFNEKLRRRVIAMKGIAALEKQRYQLFVKQHERRAKNHKNSQRYVELHTHAGAHSLIVLRAIKLRAVNACAGYSPKDTYVEYKHQLVGYRHA